MSFTIFNGFNFGKVQTQNVAAGGGAVGGWVELGRTTLGSAGDIMTVSSLPNKRYYMVLSYNTSVGGWSRPNIRFNSDSGANYSNRLSSNGGADVTPTSVTFNILANGAGSPNDSFTVSYVSNYATKEKLHQTHSITQNTIGAGTTPTRFEGVGKWANTSNAISTISIVNDGTHSFNTGSELVVLGYDPSDTHTTNFWEELSSVEWTSGSSFNTGVFATKKYLWVQAYINSTATASRWRVGNTTLDTGTNYSERIAFNGGADTTDINRDRFALTLDLATPEFLNLFIINNSANEKLIIGSLVSRNTAGAGTAPQRVEFATKWANTSNPLNIIGYLNQGSGSITSGQIKVWGSN